MGKYTASFQLWKCSGGFTYNGTNYDFKDIDSVAYTYNRKNHLTRGANAKNKVGIVTQEGLKTPDVAEYTVLDCSKEIYNLLKRIYEKEERIDAYFIDDETGEYTIFKNSVIRDKPRQTTIDESETSTFFMFAVESFDVKEKIKDE